MKVPVPFFFRNIEKLLFVSASSMTLVCFLTQLIGLKTGRWRLWGMADFFGLDVEKSLPTWFSSMLWFIVFVLTWKIPAHIRESKFFRWQWKILSGLFLVMSIDEVAGLHEKLGWFLGDHIHATGYLFFPFVIPGAILALVFFLAYLHFLARLPKESALGMIASGALFVFASIILEAVGANWTYHHGGTESQKHGLTYFLLSDTEEYLEMLASILMFRTLYKYYEKVHSAD